MANRAKRTQSLSEYLNDRVEDLRRSVSKAMKWDADAIHHARIATRRLRASFDLLGPVLSSERSREFTKSLKRLRKALGPLRNLDVMLLQLGEMASRRRCAEGVAWLVRELQQQRLGKRRRCVRKYPVEEVLKRLGSWWGLEQRVKESELAAQSLLKRTVLAHLREFSMSADRVVQTRGGEQARGQPGLHALRIKGKRLRYVLELAEPIGNPVPVSVVRSMRRLQHALGWWHDHVILGRAALKAALRQDLSVKDGRLYGEVLELARLCQARSERHFDQFVKLWNQDGPTIVKEVQQVFRPQPSMSPADDQRSDSTAIVSDQLVVAQQAASA